MKNLDIYFEASLLYNFIVNFLGILKNIISKALVSGLPNVFSNLLQQSIGEFRSPIGCISKQDCFIGNLPVTNSKGKLTFLECKDICKSSPECNYASLTSTGRCSIMKSTKGLSSGIPGYAWNRQTNADTGGLFNIDKLAHWDGKLNGYTPDSCSNLCKDLADCTGSSYSNGVCSIYKSGSIDQRFNMSGCGKPK